MSDEEHYLAHSYEELRLFPAVEEADTAIAEWEAKQYFMPGFWLALAGFTAVVAVVAYFVLKEIRPFLPQSRRMLGFIVGSTLGPLFGIFIWAGARWIYRKRFKRFLREKLVELGVPICLKCGYDLRGQERPPAGQTPRCPECGTGFVMSGSEPRP